VRVDCASGVRGSWGGAWSAQGTFVRSKIRNFVWPRRQIKEISALPTSSLPIGRIHPIFCTALPGSQGVGHVPTVLGVGVRTCTCRACAHRVHRSPFHPSIHRAPSSRPVFTLSRPCSRRSLHPAARGAATARRACWPSRAPQAAALDAPTARGCGSASVGRSRAHPRPRRRRGV
jgi:hypothetical protein